MESYGLDMDDIFFTETEVDEDIAIAAPMPDLDDDEEPINRNLDELGQNDENEDGTDAEVLKKLKDLSKGASKKKVMKPQPKLDLERLQSKRGLDALAVLFKDVQLRGKGHETRDLTLLMGKLEHWAHRLFPKLPFDDFIERLEKLGGKKPVQTCIKRIRLDMNVTHDEEVTRGLSDDEGENRQSKEGATVNTGEEVGDLDAEEAYEEMLRQEREMMEKRKAEKPTGSESPIKNLPESPSRATPKKSDTDVASTPSSTSKGLTAAQMERIAKNRQIALEKRMAKLGKTMKDQQSPAMKSAANNSSRAAEETRSTDNSQAELSQKKDDTSGDVKSGDNQDKNKLESSSASQHLMDTHSLTLKSQTSNDLDDRKPSSPSKAMDVDETEPELTTCSSNDMKTEDLALHMTESEVSEDMNLHLTESIQSSESEKAKVVLEGDKADKDISENRISESENKEADTKHLKLQLSVTDDEGSMDTD